MSLTLAPCRSILNRAAQSCSTKLIRKHYSTRHIQAIQRIHHTQPSCTIHMCKYSTTIKVSSNSSKPSTNPSTQTNDFIHLPSPAAGSIKRVVVLQKISLLEELRRGLLSDRLCTHIKNDARAHLADREHSLTIDLVKHTLQQYDIKLTVVERLEREHILDADMIVCVGGDGTFLRASRYIDEYNTIPVVGVNSSPSSSFGFFSAADHTTFQPLLQRILSGDAPMRPLWRMRVLVNDQPVGNLVLNEALFSSPLPSGTTRYVIRNSGVEQSQVSSGVWISTASGSTGAIHAAGGDIQALDDKRIQYRVRELFTLSAVKAAGPSNSGILSSIASPPHLHKITTTNSISNHQNNTTNSMSMYDDDHMSHLVRDSTGPPPSKYTVADCILLTIIKSSARNPPSINANPCSPH